MRGAAGWAGLFLGVVMLLGAQPLWGEGEASGAGRTPPLPIRTSTPPIPTVVTLPPIPGGPLVLSQEEAVRMALGRQPDLRLPEADLRAARGRTIRARAGLLPSMELQSTHLLQDSLSAAGHSRESQASLDLEQLLFDFGRTPSEVASARALEGAAEAELAVARAQVATRVRLAFHGLVAARELAGVALSNLENQKRNLALTRARWESGLGLPADVVRASSAVATATVNLNAARAREANQGVALARLLGQDPRLRLDPVCDELPAGDQTDLEVLLQEALPRRPEMQAALNEIDAARHGLRAALAFNAPALSARAGVAARGQDYPPESWFTRYGLTLRWPLVDSGQTSGLVEEAQASLDRALARHDVVCQDVASEIVVSRISLGVALDSLTAAQAARSDALESVRIAEGRYAAGLGSFLEVLDAQSALLTASNQLAAARLAAWEARAEFDRAIGRALGG